jgi:hypothetical protein
LFASRNFTSRKFRLWRRAFWTTLPIEEADGRRAFWTTLPIEEADEDQQRIALQDCKIMRSLSVLKRSQKSESENKKKGKKGIQTPPKHAYSWRWQTKARRQGRQRDDKKAKNSPDVDFCGS